MSEYPLKIISAGKENFDSAAERLVIRGITGDVCIMARHADYMTPLGIGVAKIKKNGEWEVASVCGGVLIVTDGRVTVAADSFEWQSEIDVERAEHAKHEAERMMDEARGAFEYKMAEMRLKRAINRIMVGRIK